MAYSIVKRKITIADKKAYDLYYYGIGDDINYQNIEAIKTLTGITLDMSQYQTASLMVESKILPRKMAKINKIYSPTVHSILGWMNKILWLVEPVNDKGAIVAEVGVSLEKALDYAIDTANRLRELNQTILEIHYPAKVTQNIVMLEKTNMQNRIKTEFVLAPESIKSKFKGKKQ